MVVQEGGVGTERARSRSGYTQSELAPSLHYLFSPYIVIAYGDLLLGPFRLLCKISEKLPVRCTGRTAQRTSIAQRT